MSAPAKRKAHRGVAPGDDRPRFEMLVAELSAALGEASPAEFGGKLEAAARRVCEHLALDRSGVWLEEHEAGEDLRLAHVYQRPLGLSVSEGVGPLPPAGASARRSFPWMLDQLVKNHPVVLAGVDELPAAAEVDRASCRSFGLRSVVVLPLPQSGALLGALSFVRTSGRRRWEPELLKRLEIVGHVFTTALQRRRQEESVRRSEARLTSAGELAELGFYDTWRGKKHLIAIDDRLRAIIGATAMEADALLAYWQAHVHADDREWVLEQQRRLWSGEIDSVAMEYRFSHPQRGIVWLSQVGRVLERDAQGDATRLVGVFRDISERKRERLELEEQLRFETLLSDLSARFVNLPAGEVDAAIEDAQRRLCEYLGLDLSALWEWSPDNPGSQTLTHIYRRLPGPPVPDKMDAREHFPWCLEQLAAGKPVNVLSIEDTPPEAARDREVWRHYGVKSVLTIPLSAGGGPTIGSLSFNTLEAERPWPDKLVQRIRLVAEVFANALERKRSEEALRRSYAEVTRLKARLELENLYLQKEHRLLHGQGRILGESRAIMGVLTLIEQVASTGTTALVEGETGTGKELVAQRIHELSSRHGRPMVKVNCAALPSNLVESELFGRERGAYTGAVTREAGRFEVANGSTIFLDEVAELPIELQAKLLRVLEEGQFERVGSSRTLHTDARVIAATNRDLEAEVAAGRFRRDLYYRLSAFPIKVPPLRERREDIPLLMWAIVEEFSASMHREVTSIPRRTVEALKLYAWPGNVRELRNVIERAMIRYTGPTLEVELPGKAASHLQDSSGTSLDEAQRAHIARVLEVTGGRIGGPGGAAELLGLKRTTLHSLMKRLGMLHT